LPLVTCLGTTFAGRVAASLLTSVGLPELITRSLEDYESLTMRLAADRGELRAIREKLALNAKTAPLFDTARITRNLEAAFAAMYERSRRGHLLWRSVSRTRPHPDERGFASGCAQAAPRRKTY